MTENLCSRRDALLAFGALAARATIAVEPAAVPSIIDAHVHLAPSQLTDGPSSRRQTPPFDMLEQPGGAERLAKLTERDLKAAGVAQALCMPTAVVRDEDPLGIAPTLKQAALIQGVKLHPIGVAHPEHADTAHLARVEAELKRGRVKALKAYLGYLYYDPLHPGYRPYYRLAAKYDVPIIFHTGDVNSPVAKVRYAHPLAVDEIAVDFPETKFVVAHFGNPWVMDAAQVVYKNKNVWAELSAFLIGDEADFKRMTDEGVVERTVRRVQEGIEYAEAPERFLFASDWPLSPITAYRDFVRQLFPQKLHQAVLHDNARKLFRL